MTLDTNEYVTARTAENTILYRYDEEGNLTKKTVVFADGTERASYYEQTENGTVVKYTLPCHVSIGGARPYPVTAHSKTDSFGRKVFEELQYSAGTVSRSFEYHEGAVPAIHKSNAKLKSAPITHLVSQITMFDGSTLSYEYDAEERITSEVYRYRLEEDDPWITKTTTYIRRPWTVSGGKGGRCYRHRHDLRRLRQYPFEERQELYLWEHRMEGSAYVLRWAKHLLRCPGQSYELSRPYLDMGKGQTVKVL